MNNLLFIPCYNCQKQIIRVLKKLPENIDKYFTEILIINNYSTDNTYHVIKDFFSSYKHNIKISLINNEQNYGLGGSHKIAFEYACNNNFDNIIVFHGDDQADINDILQILNLKELSNYDCYLGSRFMDFSKLNGYSIIRTYGNILFNKIFSIVLFNKIYDLGSGLNLYNTNMLKNQFYKNFPDDLTFNYMMLLSSKYYKHNIKFFPIFWTEKDQISNVKIFKQTVTLILMLFKYMFFTDKFINNNRTIYSFKFYKEDL